LLLVVIACLVMVIDSQRSKRRILKAEYNLPKEPLSLYAATGAVFVIIAVLGYCYGVVPLVPRYLLTVSIVLRPLMLIVLVLYLTRVVFDPRVHTYYEHHLKRKEEENDC